MTQQTMSKCREFLKREFNVHETLTLLKGYGYKFWSWGGDSFTNLEYRGLVFKVNGHHHKGYVLITLDWTDTYDVYIISTHGNVLNEYHMVYHEMLFDIIDDRIEKIPEYSS